MLALGRSPRGVLSFLRYRNKRLRTRALELRATPRRLPIRRNPAGALGHGDSRFTRADRAGQTVLETRAFGTDARASKSPRPRPARRNARSRRGQGGMKQLRVYHTQRNARCHNNSLIAFADSGGRGAEQTSPDHHSASLSAAEIDDKVAARARRRTRADSAGIGRWPWLAGAQRRHWCANFGLSPAKLMPRAPFARAFFF